MLIAIIILALLLAVAIIRLITIGGTNARLTERAESLGAEINRINEERELQLARLRSDNDLTIEKLKADHAERERMETERWHREFERTEKLHREAIERDRARKEELESSFRALAAQVLAAQSEQMRMQQESGLGLILNPLKEQLDAFRKSFTDTYSNEARERFSLGEHIKRLIEANNSLGNEAKELTRALRGDSKVQGDWGEMVLESILEKSGLKEGEEYFIQATTDALGNQIVNEEGAHLRPDVVLHYPNRGDVVIDSKVSLKAYTDYVNASDETSRATAIAGHVRSMRQHVRELRDKRYQDFLGARSGARTMDFVMMFVPNEGAYLTALTSDSGLWQEALESRVIIASPTHLVSVLSMIRQLWAENRMNRNSLEIADAAGKMYEKFCGFVNDMEKIRKGLESADKAYRDAMNKLTEGKGNLTSRAEKLKELGAKTAKQLSIIADKESAESDS
ncbi:MAG: DNA recombination protein RmuC [Candidatus Amulumruptor caecigallinarius]|nr:DNA recombination protein RmuC [Candidatus Amulumruptor caecigallinarius]MCM1396178.1 DNA recombination protein RmuC [Candidatus Amulumruptor caecigallinarius]MCM1453822.1 DNA recombination protein RmuC [bacterium]